MNQQAVSRLVVVIECFRPLCVVLLPYHPLALQHQPQGGDSTHFENQRCKIICQQTSRKRWFTNVNMASYCDVTNNVYPVTITTIRHCSILEYGMGACNQTVAPRITKPLHATYNKFTLHWILSHGASDTMLLGMKYSSTGVFPRKNAHPSIFRFWGDIELIDDYFIH